MRCPDAKCPNVAVVVGFWWRVRKCALATVNSIFSLLVYLYLVVLESDGSVWVDMSLIDV